VRLSFYHRKQIKKKFKKFSSINPILEKMKLKKKIDVKKEEEEKEKSNINSS